MRRWHAGVVLLGLLQAAAASRVIRRLRAGPCGPSISAGARIQPGAVSVVVPVLNEALRLEPCLEGLLAQDATVREILVVDGGSEDGTEGLVRAVAHRDPRVRLLDSAPIPPDWNGKAWGLEVGRRAASAASPWLLTIDADVRPRAGLAAGLVARALADRVVTASVATVQDVSGPALGLLHPACLTTLVYRLGRPGRVARYRGEVQANGQCQLLDREALRAAGGFGVARASRCEDVTIARTLVVSGGLAAFYETDGLVSVRMYDRWHEAWNGWTRSLPLRDRYTPWSSLVGLAEVTLAQGLPLPLLALLLGRGPGARGDTACRLLVALNVLLLVLRVGVLVGIRRAYSAPPWTFWLAPLADFPVALRLWASILKRRHTWRGRPLVTGVHS
ncbi:MAG: glycosyltransferase [Chloroflexi bacterium]|nr:glycosyltransferase [Chloroflexota bacterium]